MSERRYPVFLYQFTFFSSGRIPYPVWLAKRPPLSRSRPGRTMARRSLCSHVQAVSKLWRPSTRCNPKALAPFCWVVTHQMARNQTG